MIAKLQMTLAGVALGRIALHLCAIVSGGKVRWHWRGILREVTPDEPANWDGDAGEIFKSVR